MRAYRLKSARRAYWRLNGPQSLGAFQRNHIFAERNGVRDVAHLHEFTDRRERPCGALWKSKPVIEDSDQYLSRQSRNTVSQCPCPDHAQIPAPTYRQRPTLRTLAATPQRCALELVSAQPPTKSDHTLTLGRVGQRASQVSYHSVILLPVSFPQSAMS